MKSAYAYLCLFLLWLVSFTLLAIKITTLGIVFGLIFIVSVGVYRGYRRSERRQEKFTVAT